MAAKLRLLLPLLISVCAAVLAGCPAGTQQGRVVSPPVAKDPAAAPISPVAPGQSTANASTTAPADKAPADPLTTPPAELPDAAVKPKTPPSVAGVGKTRYLPPDLPVADYSGQGVLIEVFATAATPRAGRGDPAQITFTCVAQRAKGDFDITKWQSTLPKPVMHSVPAGGLKLEITPRWLPQQLAVRLPNGQVPLLNEGFYDVVVRDAKGRPLGLATVSGTGFLTFSNEDKQPQGHMASAVREGQDPMTHLDFMPLDGSPALLRLECSGAGGQDTLNVTSGDGDVHQLLCTHAVLRVLPPGTFTTTAEQRAEDKYPRNPK